MQRFLTLLSVLLVALAAGPSLAADARFTGTLRLLTSFGTNVYTVPLLTTSISGTADVSAGVVRIPANVINVAIPPMSGLAGTLMNGPGTFSPGGAGPGSTCPLIAIQEVCIEGGGFGGPMRLSGVTQLGQDLVVWGSAGSTFGMTGSGVLRLEEALPWTTRRADAIYYIIETDITPFGTNGTGTFLGLPSTAGVDAGFSMVTPMVVTTQLPSSAGNFRALAHLQIVFTPPSVPIGATALLLVALTLIGTRQLSPRDGREPTGTP